MVNLFSYGSLTGQALHLSFTAGVGTLIGGDGRMVQPLYLGPTAVIPPGPGYGECPQIIDTLILAPVIVDSGVTRAIPELVASSDLRPTLVDSEAEPDKPEVVDSTEIKPTIIDSGTKGCN